ncbi:DUF3465 domain-containing protein [Aquirhabdus parva]|uniref:DUF3465 domain-containing protein n=1 Tax=Aquirhabdus parva TaxID=2283318 RepID=UPI001D197275|nr:DUF3465 domain-containing protein [Aquirhabdus parva]
MNRPLSVKTILFILALCVGYFLTTRHEQSHPSLPNTPVRDSSSYQSPSRTDQPPQQSFDHRTIEGSGQVVKILPDDNKAGGINGSRHQRFLLRLDSGQTVLVAHNIDLAPRIDHLRVGGTVEFKGEFINNDRGGVLHWTHRDPNGRHTDGWLKYGGQIYQ